MAQRKGMSFGGAMFLLLAGGVAWMTLERAVAMAPDIVRHESGIHASDDCYEQDSGSMGVWLFRYTKKAIRDQDCEKREAARLAAEVGLPEHAKTIVCALAGSVATYGSEAACMAGDTSATHVVTAVVNREIYCERRAKGILRRIEKLWDKGHFYRACVRGEK